MARVSSFLNSKKKYGAVTGAGLIGAGVDGLSTYAIDRAENPDNSPLTSALKGGANAAAWMFAEPVMWAITLGGLAKSGAEMLYEDSRDQYNLKQDIKSHVRADKSGNMHGSLGGNFQDSEKAYTMRQRQMDLLRQHRMSTEAVLGSEARQLHK